MSLRSPLVSYQTSKRFVVSILLRINTPLGPKPHGNFWLVQLSVLTTLAWMVTGHWILQDVLGMGLCVTYVAHLRLPNLKVSMPSPKQRRSAWWCTH